MTDAPPLLDEAYRALIATMRGYLDDVEFLAERYSPWDQVDADLAREVLPELVTMVRGVLRRHSRTTDGTCAGCTAVWPCADVRAVHAELTNHDRAYGRIRDHALSLVVH